MLQLTDLTRQTVSRPTTLTRVIALVLCFALLFATVEMTPPAAVTAQSIDELNSQKDELASKQEALEQQRDETAKTLEEQEAQADVLRQQISAKSEEIAVNEQLLSTLDSQIADKTSRIAEQESTIASLEDTITAQYQALRRRLREISKFGSVSSTLQLLLSSSRLTDYLISFKVSERIAAHDQEMMNALEEDIKAVEAAKSQTVNDKAALEIERTQVAQVQADMEESKAGLQTLYAEADALADEMAQNVEYLDEQIAAIDAEQAYLQNTIDAVMAQIRAEEEARRQEEERRRQEEEERKKQEAEQNGTSSDGDADSDGDNDDTDDDEVNASISNMVWPAPTCKVITSSYKYRQQFGRWHRGLDIARYGSAEGHEIVAAADGTVVYTNRYDTWGGGYGLYAMIDHGYDDEGRRILTIYSHCSSVSVYEGLEVKAGDTVGAIGNTGNSYGAHLHFEVQVDGVAVDPVGGGYLSTAGVDILG